MNIDALFYEYHKPLISYAYALTNDTLAAEDIVTEVFINAWKVEKPIDKVRGYLFTSVRNKSFDYLKHHKIETAFVNSYSHFEPEHYEIMEEVITRLWLEIDKLPKQCRNVVNLYLQGISIRDIGKELNISHKTVHSQKTVAIHLLRKLLKHGL